MSKDTSGVEEKLVKLVLISKDGEAEKKKESELSERPVYQRHLEEEIERKETLARKLQQTKDLELSVEVLEQILIEKLQLYGPEAEQVFDTCEQLTLAYNTYAMRLIDKEHFDSACELLKKAEVLTDKDSELSRTRKPISRLRAVTFNNLGCLFKHRRNFYTAIKYLEKALSIEESTSYAENPASTHLNLCATLSKCGRHDKALTYAKAALKILNKQLSLKSSSTLREFKDAFDSHKSHPKLLSTLAIAYHNAATQHEYLNYFDEASACYKQAKTIGGLCWMRNSPMSASLRQSHAEFKQKIAHYKKSAASSNKDGGALRRPQSAGPRLGSSRISVYSRPSSARRRKKKATSKFSNVPINTVRIYTGEPLLHDAKENIVVPTDAKSAAQMKRPSSARPRIDSSAARGKVCRENVPRYVQGKTGRTARPKSAVN